MTERDPLRDRIQDLGPAAEPQPANSNVSGVIPDETSTNMLHRQRYALAEPAPPAPCCTVYTPKNTGECENCGHGPGYHILPGYERTQTAEAKLARLRAELERWHQVSGFNSPEELAAANQRILRGMEKVNQGVQVRLEQVQGERDRWLGFVQELTENGCCPYDHDSECRFCGTPEGQPHRDICDWLQAKVAAEQALPPKG